MAEGKYTYAVGRRKTSIAQIRLFKGKGENMINGTDIKEKFSLKTWMVQLMKPFVVTETMGEYYFEANVKGGGNTGQLEAIRHGISRALVKVNDDYRPVLKTNGFLKRDPRMKERKKPYTRGARKGRQYSKR